ncbi:MAG: hypothetical protein ACRDPB_10740 [Nocardioidaceae bacterium]
MRTTVTLDPDTEEIVRERMARKGLSFKQAINETIRDGAQGRVEREPYVMKPRSLGKPKLELTKALQLSGELEDEHTLAVIRGVAE